MTSNTSEIPADAQRIRILCTVDDLKTEGHAIRRDYRKDERIQRAMKAFGICFGIAFLTIFIPVLHFILPPLFLIIGGDVATTTFMETSQVLGGEITCPNCKKVMELRPEPEEWPKAMRCEGCSFSLTLIRD